ncbi:uncharacterized protein [Argopecten irradians]|uniref:uncharacterized protein n=1 Tax=Argopecten irradians TaxID=31199 RepID=UPI003722A4B4
MFNTFVVDTGLTRVWPPPLSQILNFVLYMADKGLSPATVNTYLAGINFHVKSSGFLCEDFLSNFLVKKMLAGMRRQRKVSNMRAPITADILARILKALPLVCSSTYESKLFSAAFLLAFFGFFRVGELTVTKMSMIQKVVSLQDIKIGNILEVALRFSKTDQEGKGCTVCIPRLEGTFCPVKCLEQYITVRHRNPGPLFCHFDHSPLTRYQFASVLKKTLLFLGFDSNRYKTHSFRIGAATEAAIRGLSDREIQLLGRWSSDTFRQYIRIPEKVMLELKF